MDRLDQLREVAKGLSETAARMTPRKKRKKQKKRVKKSRKR